MQVKSSVGRSALSWFNDGAESREMMGDGKGANVGKVARAARQAPELTHCIIKKSERRTQSWQRWGKLEAR